MMIELQLWQLVSLLVTFLGGMIGGCKWMFDKIEKRQGERFDEFDDRIGALARRTDDQAHRLAAQGGDIARAPSREDIVKVCSRIDEIHALINAVDARNNRIEGAFQEHSITMRSLLNHFIDKGVGP
jgi:hypothetical protein